MRFLSHLSLVVALTVAGALAISAMPQDAQAAKKKKGAKPPKIELSKEFSNVAGPIQKLVEAGDPSAKPMVEQRPWTGNEADVAGQFAITLGTKLKDTELQEKGINKRLESGMLSGANKANLLFYSGSFARGRGDNAAAEKQLLAAIAEGYQGPDAHLELANSYSSQKQHRKSLQYLSQAIDIQNKTNRPVPEGWYRASRDRALATNDRQLYADWAAKWAAAYPSSESWGDAVTAYRYKSNANSVENLEILRFMKASGALTKLHDYQEFAEEAQKRGLVGDVVAVLEEGRRKNIVSANNFMVAEFLVPAKRKVSGDRASLPTTPSEVRGSGSSSVMMNFADVWLGYEDYAKAAAFYLAGIGKPGADANRGNIGIGTAHILADDLSAANIAFDKVLGARAPLAAMWKTWIKQQNKPAVVETTVVPADS